MTDEKLREIVSEEVENYLKKLQDPKITIEKIIKNINETLIGAYDFNEEGIAITKIIEKKILEINIEDMRILDQWVADISFCFQDEKMEYFVLWFDALRTLFSPEELNDFDGAWFADFKRKIQLSYRFTDLIYIKKNKKIRHLLKDILLEAESYRWKNASLKEVETKIDELSKMSSRILKLHKTDKNQN